MIGISLSFVGLSVTVFQAFVIRPVLHVLANGRPPYWHGQFGIFGLSMRCLIPYGGIILALFLLLNGFSGLAPPALNAMMSQRTPPSQQGELQGLIGSMAALAMMIAQFSLNIALAHFTEAGAAISFSRRALPDRGAVSRGRHYRAVPAAQTKRTENPNDLVGSLKICQGQGHRMLARRGFRADRHSRTAYKLREGSQPIGRLSFALQDSGGLIGSIQCWPVQIDRTKLVLVGPVAVDPAKQNEGHGHRLMHSALEAAAAIGNPAMVMIGDPEYYGRFGFSAAATGGWTLPGRWEPRRLLARNVADHALPSRGMLERPDAL